MSTHNPPIIDLTAGVCASTSPMMSPLSRSRSQAREQNFLASDSDEDIQANVGTKTVTAHRRPRAAHSKTRRIIEEESEDEEEGVVVKKEGEKSPTTQHVSLPQTTVGAAMNANGDSSDGNMQSMVDSSKKSPEAGGASKLEQAYLKARRTGVKKRSFDLDRIPPEEIIPTGRTIKRMSAWSGHWPALREFMQNTIDHLGLLDPRTGRRHEALRLRVEAGRSPRILATFQFICGQETVCSITASKDELVIDQLYTFPIAPRALDTGVPDTEKSNSSNAGGFGDGFKTAAVALLALGKDFKSLEWHFFAEGQRIDWSFEGANRAAVGTFAKCQVLQVCISRQTDQYASIGEGPIIQENTMRQVIKVRNIGKSFVEQTVPRLVVFWDLDHSTLLSSSLSGGDFIGPALVQPAIGGGALGPKVLPESGVFVKGIWVRKAKIAGTLMCFFGRRLEVNGRDRNDVDDDELIYAVVYVFSHCSNQELLRQLLSPLKGRSAAAEIESQAASGSSSSSSTRSKTASRRTNDASWLLKSPRFMNNILEQYKDIILHKIMGVPKGAIYVSSKTTNSSDPFVKWASEFLPKSGCPLEPIEPGANRYLFQEVSEAELVERCVDVLKRQRSADKGGHAAVLSTAFRKVLTFMGLSRAKAIFSPLVAVAFVHKHNIYAPEAPLTRELLVKVLNVCQSHLDGADGERFSSLMQAAFETLPPGTARTLTPKDIDDAIKKAKSIQKENKGFLVNPGNHSSDGDTQRCSSSGTSKKKKSVERTVTPEAIDLTGDSPNAGRTCRHSTSTTERVGRKRHAPATLTDLENQIALVSRAAEAEGGEGRRGQLPPIIPASDFGRDEAGTDSCLRGSSQLRRVEVDESMGGGSLLCDPDSADSMGRLSGSVKARICALRVLLGEAQDLVGAAIPSLGPLLRRVRHGYDSSNDTYEAFCDGTQIVVNLFANLPKLPRAPAAGASPRSQGLVHDLAITITHELAHFLEPREGHGPVWRDTHMRMVTEVMNYVSQDAAEDAKGSNKRRKRG